VTDMAVSCTSIEVDCKEILSPPPWRRHRGAEVSEGGEAAATGKKIVGHMFKYAVFS